MDSVLQKVSRRKIGEVLESLAAGFGAALLVQDCSGRVVLAAGTADADLKSFSSLARRDNKTLFTESLHFREMKIGSLVVSLGSGKGADIASGIARSLESFIGLEGEIENLSSEIVRVYEELSLIHKVSGMLGNEMDVERICRLVLEEADKILSVDTLFLMLLDAERKDLYSRYAIGSHGEPVLGFRVSMTQDLVSHVFRQGEPLTICDIVADGRFKLPYPAQRILFVPLVADIRPVGMLVATDKLSGEEFWSQELQLMGIFASEVSSALQKANLYEEINKLFLSTVKALATAIDAKDPYTYGHSRRVAELSVAIGHEMGIERDRVRRLELASLLHDIGKIGTPENILRKPGMLQPEEYEKIKEHPAKGAEILSMIAEFSDIVTWIRHHHEWYDGTGYPDRIAAENIPVEARIIAIADSYDAMTSDRPYRKGMPPDTVVHILEQFSRSQFDPLALDAFISCLHKGIVA